MYEDFLARQHQPLQTCTGHAAPSAEAQAAAEDKCKSSIMHPEGLPEQRPKRAAALRKRIIFDATTLDTSSSDNELFDGNADNFPPRARKRAKQPPHCSRNRPLGSKHAEKQHPCGQGQVLSSPINSLSSQHNTDNPATSQGGSVASDPVIIAPSPASQRVTADFADQHDPICTALSPASHNVTDEPNEEDRAVSQHETESQCSSLDTEIPTDVEHDSSDADHDWQTTSVVTPRAHIAAKQAPLMPTPAHLSSSASALGTVQPTPAATALASPTTTSVASQPQIAVTEGSSATETPSQLAGPKLAANTPLTAPSASRAQQQSLQPTVEASSLAASPAASGMSQQVPVLAEEVANRSNAGVDLSIACLVGEQQRQTAATSAAAPLPAAPAIAKAKVVLPQSYASTSAAAPTASQISLRQAVAAVNQRLQGISDHNVITDMQIQGLEASLSGMSDLLSLEKGDIKDVLMDKTFGGNLTQKQALYMQVYVLELKQL